VMVRVMGKVMVRVMGKVMVRVMGKVMVRVMGKVMGGAVWSNRSTTFGTMSIYNNIIHFVFNTGKTQYHVSKCHTINIVNVNRVSTCHLHSLYDAETNATTICQSMFASISQNELSYKLHHVTTTIQV